MNFERVIWIVLDSVGIGEMPDAAKYGDVGSDTLGNIARQRPLHLPNLCRLGVGNIKPLTGLPPAAEPSGAFGKCALASPGKDTTTGHWEMVGIHLEKPFPLFPQGFPPEVMEEFAKIYPKLNDFVNSTAAARANGYAHGLGSNEDFEREAPSLGLSDGALSILRQHMR